MAGYDEIDDRILSILRANSRTHNIEIAKQVGLTEGAVRNRINKMVKRGLIKRFTIESGRGSVFAIVLIKSKRDTKKMMEDLKKIQIKERYEISGSFDGCAILEEESLDMIDQRIDQIRSLREVSDTRTFISLRKG